MLHRSDGNSDWLNTTMAVEFDNLNTRKLPKVLSGDIIVLFDGSQDPSK